MAFISAVSNLAAAQRLRNASKKTTFSTNGVNFDAILRQVVRCGKRSGWCRCIGLKHIYDLAVSARCLRQRERRWSDFNFDTSFFRISRPLAVKLSVTKMTRQRWRNFLPLEVLSQKNWKGNKKNLKQIQHVNPIKTVERPLLWSNKHRRTSTLLLW